MQQKVNPSPYLTPAAEFRDVSRGDPKPFTLVGEALEYARLTPKTWRLEIQCDGSSKLQMECTIANATALDLPALIAIGKTHAVKFLKGMQCLNIPQPLGQGLWEGVPLRELLKRVGKVSDVRRVYYWGFHNNDPAQLFKSSLSYTQVMEAPPWELPPLVVYRLNGEPIPLVRGGPVRMIVPWAHGFKSIKWLQRIVMTNDHRANDTYADGNNDIDSYLKTAAYLGETPTKFDANKPAVIAGTVVSGWSGLKRVEYWLRPDTGLHGTLADDDPAWQSARWLPCKIEPAPDDWSAALPNGVLPKEIWGFDSTTGAPKDWPMRYSIGQWSVQLEKLAPGMYEFRVRAVDLNGFAQPQPRPYQKSGRNAISVQCFEVKK